MNLPFEIFLSLRYLRPKRTFVSAITVISVLGVTLGVMVLVVVIPVMSGFDRLIKEKLMGFNAHVIVATGEVMWDAPSLQQQIVASLAGSNGPRIEFLAANVIGPVLMEARDRFQIPYLKGIEDRAEGDPFDLRSFVVAGTYDLGWDRVLLGTDLASHMDLMPGDRITVTGPGALRAEQELVLPRDLEVAGIFQTGLWEFDYGFLVTGLETAQDIYEIPGGVHHIEVMIDQPERAEAVARILRRELGPGYDVSSWMERNARLFSALRVEKNVMLYLLMFIILVAAFGLCSTLITIVVEKTREIGTLMAVGASPGQIAWIFLAQGLVVGVLGAAIGLGSGLLLLRYRNAIVDFVSRLTGVGLFEKDIYHFGDIPALVVPQDVGTIVLSAVAICLLAALIPALRAGRMDPAAALRAE